MATIKDVSNVAKVSIGTVSRYLNGYYVKEVNRRKIEEAIKELNFKINMIAKGLKTNKTYTIGVVVPSVTDPFCNYLIEGIDSELENINYSLITCSSRNSVELEKEKIKLLKNKRVDGIIIMPINSDSTHILKYFEKDIPIVLIDRLLTSISSDAVVIENTEATYNATKYLIEKGHTRIGIVSGHTNIYTGYKRLQGYLDAFQDSNLIVDNSLIKYVMYQKGEGLEEIKELINLKDKPTAILATNYETTYSCIKYMLMNNIKIGKDISFFGFDNFDILDIVSPSITTVVQPIIEIGKESVKILNRRINGDYNDYPLIKKLKTKILEGSSIKEIVSK